MEGRPEIRGITQCTSVNAVRESETAKRLTRKLLVLNVHGVSGCSRGGLNGQVQNRHPTDKHSMPEG